VSGDFSRRSGVCGNGGGGFFCEVASEHEFELGGVELLAGLTEDAAAEDVDGLDHEKVPFSSRFANTQSPLPSQ
jgi:hypothetical protein